MANVLKNIFDPGVDQISQNYIIESWHVSQSVDAFTGAKAYDITLSGSYTLTGSQYVTGSISASGGTNTIGFYGTSSWAVSSSKAISSSFASTSSYNVTSSFALTSSFSTTASYYAYGTNLIGTTHGDGAKETDLPLLMAQEASEHWHGCKHRYFYTEHIHHKKSKDYICGCSVNQASSISLRSSGGGM